MAQSLVILGAGESGTGAAILGKEMGYDVFVSDSSPIKQKYLDELREHKISFEEKQHSEEKILAADLVVKSPGIPNSAPLIRKLTATTIPVISEIEFAGRYTTAKKICITGSNGKTTTTLLTYHILKNAGVNVGLAGNVGKSMARQVAQNQFDHYVIELSSFQLDNMTDFKAEIAMITNITPDHLDRYDYEFQKYIDSKFRILRNQTQTDAFIFNADDKATMIEIDKREIKARLYPITLRDHLPLGNEGAFVTDNHFTIQTNQNQFNMKITDLALQGKHNLYNSMAAGVAGRILELRKEVVRESLEHFESVEHRMEFVAKVHGISFINDSKATNINSSWYALESMDKPVIWIAGGQDKGNDYNELTELVKSKVKAIICLTKDSSKIRKAFSGNVQTIVDVQSAEQAVRIAYDLGIDGDVVLLSPACASFDLFENYEDRGRQFKTAVRGL